MKALFVLITLTASASFVQAQSPVDQGPPQGPLLNRAPESSQWTIVIQPPPPPPKTAGGEGDDKPAAAAPPVIPVKPRIITVIKSNHLIYETVITEAGGKIETWRTDKWVVVNPNASGWIIAPNGGSTFNSTDYSKSDFAGFDWIALNNYTGVRDVMGKHCFIFKDKVLTLDPEEIQMMNVIQSREANPANRTLNMDSLKVEVEADIDEKTRLPVQLIYNTDHGVMTRSYVFQTPESSLSLPTEIQELLRKFQQYQRRLSVPIAPI